MAAKFVPLQNMIQTLSNFMQTVYTCYSKSFTQHNLRVWLWTDGHDALTKRWWQKKQIPPLKKTQLF